MKRSFLAGLKERSFFEYLMYISLFRRHEGVAV